MGIPTCRPHMLFSVSREMILDFWESWILMCLHHKAGVQNIVHYSYRYIADQIQEKK